MILNIFENSNKAIINFSLFKNLNPYHPLHPNIYKNKNNIIFLNTRKVISYTTKIKQHDQYKTQDLRYLEITSKQHGQIIIFMQQKNKIWKVSCIKNN